MNDDTAINRNSIKHAYQQVADAIAARITAGYYTIKLPSERHLAEEFGVSYITVRHATAVLRDRSLIVSIHGRGTYIGAALTATSRRMVYEKTISRSLTSLGANSFDCQFTLAALS